MRIRHKKSGSTAQRITLNLASMIDVTFLLLIYFIVVTVVEAQENRLDPTLQTESEDSAGQSNDFTPQVVEVALIDGAPAYRLGARVMSDRAALFAALETLPREQGLFVKVFGGVDVGFAIAAIQTARDCGFDQVTYVPQQ